jgi:hypothetical protein
MPMRMECRGITGMRLSRLRIGRTGREIMSMRSWRGNNRFSTIALEDPQLADLRIRQPPGRKGRGGCATMLILKNCELCMTMTRFMRCTSDLDPSIPFRPLSPLKLQPSTTPSTAPSTFLVYACLRAFCPTPKRLVRPERFYSCAACGRTLSGSLSVGNVSFHLSAISSPLNTSCSTWRTLST